MHGHGQLLQNINLQNPFTTFGQGQQPTNRFYPIKCKSPILLPFDLPQQSMETKKSNESKEKSASVELKTKSQQTEKPQIFLHFNGQLSQRIRHIALQNPLDSKLKFFILISR